MSDIKITVDLLDSIASDVVPKDGSFEVTRLSDPKSLCVVDDWVSSGCLPIDMITGGGFPVGRVTEIYGDNSTGKSLLAAQAVIEAQHRDMMAVFVDTESAVSRPLMEEIGVDTELLLYMTPNTVGEVFETLEKVVEAKNKELGVKHPMIFVWDTVAATTTKEERDTIREKGLEQKQFSAGAMQISRALRSGWARTFARSNICAIFVNQIREKPGVLFGEKEGTYGGKAISFYATLRIALNNKATIKDTKDIVGHRVKIVTKKNKTFPPFRSCEVPVYFGHGFDDAEATYDFMKELGLLDKTAWQTLVLGGEEIKFQKSGWCEPDGVFDAHYDEIEAMIRAAYR